MGCALGESCTCACAYMCLCGDACARVRLRVCVCACVFVYVRAMCVYKCECARVSAHMCAAAHACACTYRSDSATRLAGVKKPGLPFGVRTCRHGALHVAMQHSATPHRGNGRRLEDEQSAAAAVRSSSCGKQCERALRTLDTTAMTRRTATGRTSMTSALDVESVIVIRRAVMTQGYPFSPRLEHRQNASQRRDLLWLGIRHHVRGREQALHKPWPRNVEVTLQRDLLEVVHAELEHER